MPIISDENGFMLTIFDGELAFKRDGAGIVYGNVKHPLHFPQLKNIAPGENYYNLGPDKKKVGCFILRPTSNLPIFSGLPQGFSTVVRCGGANVYARGGLEENTDRAMMHLWETDPRSVIKVSQIYRSSFRAHR